MKFALSEQHMNAVNRPRRAIHHLDATDPMVRWGLIQETDPKKFFDSYKKRLWQRMDRDDNPFDSIHLDACYEDEFAYCHKSFLPQIRRSYLRNMFESGIDLYDEYVSDCRKRGLECILVHRISGTEMVESDDEPISPLRASHPEYFIKDWMVMPDLAVPEVRENKLRMLTECIENYEFDGLEIDFCRHTPFLDPGHQWELRENATEFMRMLREMTQRIEKKQNRAVLLSARVSESIDGCHIDGLDIEQWAEENLVDTLTIGTRSFEVDLKSFRDAVKGKVKLFPCLDMHHQSDLYNEPKREVYAGVFANFYAQGADSIVIFNPSCCDTDVYQATIKEQVSKFDFQHRCYDSENTAYPLLQNIKTLEEADKTFVIERRGGYPWNNGYANNNMTKQLPLELSNNGNEHILKLYAGDIICKRDVKELTLSVLLYNIRPIDKLAAELNGVKLNGECRGGIKDKRIVPFGKEFVSGFYEDILPERAEIFTEFCFDLTPSMLHTGDNYISLSLKRAVSNYQYCSRVEVEKIELSVKYNSENA